MPRHRFSMTIARGLAGAAIVVLAGASASADDASAKKILKGMSDYMAAQKALSFNYDAALDVVTNDEQKLTLLSSGTVTLQRPDKVRVTRAGGFADVEVVFDGSTLTLLGKNLNLYAQVDAPGSVDHLVDELQEKLQRPMPAADLLLSNAYDELMSDVTDIKDLGSGVVGGAECDFLAFRKKDVDFQIWVAQGDRPYPCRYTITSRVSPAGPQYSIQIRDFKSGSDVAAADFTFKNATGATRVEPAQAREKFSDLPSNFTLGTVGAAK